MLTDPIINWKGVLKGKGLSRADLAGFNQPVNSSGFTRQERKQLFSALSANQAQLVSLLPQDTYTLWVECIRSNPFFAREQFVIAEHCLIFALSNTI